MPLTRYRPPEDAREPHRFARWLRALWGVDVSGVYVIRDASTRETLYVGESHSGRLYDTITRHLQSWRTGHQSGQSYERTEVEIAIEVTRRNEALERQNDFIADLLPRDNRYRPDAVIDDDEVPF